jgi:hypothetical protein
MNITEIESVGMNWTALARDRNKWRAVVNAVMNHKMSIKCGGFLRAQLTAGYCHLTACYSQLTAGYCQLNTEDSFVWNQKT